MIVSRRDEKRTPRPGLADARKRAGLTQESLGDDIGVNKWTISQWETGGKAPALRNRFLLARALDISREELDRLIRGEPLFPVESPTEQKMTGGLLYIDGLYTQARAPTEDEPMPGNAGVAKRLDEKYQGRWLVLWSWWSQTFLAWPTWIGGSGKSLESSCPEHLERLMIEQEECAGIRPLFASMAVPANAGDTGSMA
jgi:DNA-binding XRE family transcriptional regulator